MTASLPVVYLADKASVGSVGLRTAGVVDVGRASKLFALAAAGHPCRCGSLFGVCDLWGPTLHDVMTPSTTGLQAAARLTRAAEVDLTIRRVHVVRYAHLWRRTLTAVADHAKADVVIDGSANGASTVWRPRRLSSVLGLDVTVIGAGRAGRLLVGHAGALASSSVATTIGSIVSTAGSQMQAAAPTDRVDPSTDHRI